MRAGQRDFDERDLHKRKIVHFHKTHVPVLRISSAQAGSKAGKLCENVQI